MGERNIDELIEKKEWMIRPCLLYQEEYKDCRSLASRFHQKFVYGSVIDCSQWKRDYDNCLRWTDKQDKRSFVELIDSEESRRKERLDAHYGNDIWEKRVSPPPGWNDPLPPWIEEKIKNSYLTLKAQDVKNEKDQRTFCVIS